MNYYYGYGLILIYSFLMIFIYVLSSRKGKENEISICNYLMANKNIPTFLLTTSIFSSWVWVTTIVGSAEACLLYGMTGAIGYSVGAAISFFVFILIISNIKKLMPESTSFLEFIGERYTLPVKDLYYVFAVLTTVYVAIEQAAGVSFVLNGIFDTSYKKIAFFSVMLAVIFVMKSGMIGILYNEFISFFIIIIGLSIFIISILQIFDINDIQKGLIESKINSGNFNYNPDVINIASVTGIRYTIMAIVIAFGQILFDPAYYLKASLAKNDKELKKAFLLGGIIMWCPVGIVSALTLGFVSISLNLDFSKSLNISSEIPTKLITMYLGNHVGILFSFVIICIGITTICHYMVGIQSIFTIDFYKNKIKPNASEGEKIRFGKVAVLLVGVFCGLIAISLENVSLLTIDMFCGVFFAAPCGALFSGIMLNKEFKNLPIFSIAIGIASGFYVWLFMIDDKNWAWFWGTLTSFLAPIVMFAIASLIITKEYNFNRLKHWRP